MQRTRGLQGIRKRDLNPCARPDFSSPSSQGMFLGDNPTEVAGSELNKASNPYFLASASERRLRAAVIFSAITMQLLR